MRRARTVALLAVLGIGIGIGATMCSLADQDSGAQPAPRSGSSIESDVAAVAAPDSVRVRRESGAEPARDRELTEDADAALLAAQVVRVRVVDARGNPIAHATISIAGPPAPPRLDVLASTDQGGRAELRVTGTEQLLIAAEGYASVAWSPDRSDGTVERVLTLEEGRSLRGRVIGPSGQGVAGARVEFTFLTVAAPAITDGVGGFEFDRTLPMTALNGAAIIVTATGFAPTVRPTSTSTSPLVIRLAPPLELSGRVIDTAGVPLAGADVVWESRSTAEGDVARVANWTVHETKSDSQGRFSFKARARAGGPLSAEFTRHDAELGHPARWRGIREVSVTNVDRTVDLVVERAQHSYLRVRALSPEGAPLANTRVSVPGSSKPLSANRRTDANGIAIIVLASPAGARHWVNLELRAGYAPPKSRWVVAMDASDGPATDLVVRPTSRVTLVFVGDDGTPLDGDRWLTEDTDGGTSGLRVENGVIVRYVNLAQTATLSGEIPSRGRYTVTVDPAQAAGAPVPVSVTPGATVRGSISVRGGGVPEGTVSLTVQAQDAERYFTRRIAGDGQFQFASALPGTFSLMVLSPDGTILAMRTGTLDARETLDLGELSADPAHWVTTQILDVTGRPASGAEVEYLYSPTWESLGWETANDAGEVRGPPAPGSHVILRVYAGARGVALAQMAEVRDDAQIRLVPASVLRVRLAAPQGSEPWLEAWIRPPGTDAWIEHREVEFGEDYAEGEDDDVFVVWNLAPGDVRIRMGVEDTEGNEYRAEHELTVGTGERRELELRAKRVDDGE